jgi:acetolactate synthase-1/2/3 large subunit
MPDLRSLRFACPGYACYPAAIGAVADLKQALKALLRAARKLCPQGVQCPGLVAEMAANRAAFAESNREWAESDAFPMTPQRILADLRRALPRDSYICTDVGWNKESIDLQIV